MSRYVTVHGHFYQPPRENPWTGEVDEEASARPFHDWNERITAECYAPNAANYARMSFNFGPTLLSWLEGNAPDAYQAILRGDAVSRERFSGHGSAIAQAYSHPILPLANRRDKVVQVAWGIRDFESRFGRRPEGMWLPETAVDEETLEVLAEQGIAFTILAPTQANGVREIGARDWQEVPRGGIDGREPYRVPLRSGRDLAVFFYDGGLAHGVAFGALARDGGEFARGLLSRFRDSSDGGPGGPPGPRSGGGPGGPPGTGSDGQLVHVATDGETYGHHFRGGERALAEALDAVEAGGARLTNYAEHLRRFPPRREARIVPRTSWSCAHGVSRWGDDCGCSAGRAVSHPWRRPLREALDWLRDTLAPLYEAAAAPLLRDPWLAREEAIDLVLDPSPAGIDAWLDRHAVAPLAPEDRATALGLLEMQRYAILMYTSCGWFFDDPGGLETRQVLRYAARAVELAEEHLGGTIEPLFLKLLERVRSGFGEKPDGTEIYRTLRSPLPPGEARLPS